MGARTVASETANTCSRSTRLVPRVLQYSAVQMASRNADGGLTEGQSEMDRMDIYHKFFSVARNEALHSTTFVPNYDKGPRILDLGCGTGIWAIDMAE